MKGNLIFILGCVGIITGVVLLIIVSMIPDACAVRDSVADDGPMLIEADPGNWSEEIVEKRVQNLGYLCSGQVAIYSIIVIGIVGGGICLIIWKAIENANKDVKKGKKEKRYFS